MEKKFLARLVGLLAIVAVAMIPVAAAQAAPHYYKNKVVGATGKKTPTIAWGKLTLKPAAGPGIEVTCRNAAGGFSENPAPAGSPGTGQTELFAPYECETVPAICPAGFHPGVHAQSLPWANKLIELGAPGDEENGKPTIRQETTGVNVKIGCIENADKTGTVVGGVEFTGANRPNTGNSEVSPEFGKSATFPGFLEFDNPGPGNAGSGTLSEVGGAGVGKTEGQLKTLGYEKQELLNTLDP